MKIVIILVLKVLKLTLNMFLLVLLVCVFSLQHGRATLPVRSKKTWTDINTSTGLIST